MTALLPCPFCGGQPVLDSVEVPDDEDHSTEGPIRCVEVWWVTCRCCDIATPLQRTREAAVGLWQRRV